MVKKPRQVYFKTMKEAGVHELQSAWGIRASALPVQQWWPWTQNYYGINWTGPGPVSGSGPSLYGSFKRATDDGRYRRSDEPCRALRRTSSLLPSDALRLTPCLRTSWWVQPPRQLIVGPEVCDSQTVKNSRLMTLNQFVRVLS